jgi:glycosyltransferase 2 family protein
MSRHREHKVIKSYFSFKKISIPVIIGLGIAIFMIYRNFDRDIARQIHWTFYSIFWLLSALLLVAIRDIAYMYRIILLSDGRLSIRQAFQVIMLWEFASSVTPGIVGGAAFALYIIHKEGIEMGRTTAIVMISAMLDELFFLLVVPLVFLIGWGEQIFPLKGTSFFLGVQISMKGFFYIGYFFLMLLTLIILWGIFISPQGFKALLVGFTKIPFLKKLRRKAIRTGNEIILTSTEFKRKSFVFWLKAFGATFFSWTARYWVVNFLIMAFVVVDQHFLIYARQLIMWVIMLVSPTPGSSGVAEFVFSGFLGSFIPSGLAPVLALLWRLISYYPYLIIGAVIIPIWFKRVHLRAKREKQALALSENKQTE